MLKDFAMWKHRPRPASELIIAVDFDGTIVENHDEFPKLGKDAGAGWWLRQLYERDVRAILWTVRHGESLALAVDHWTKICGTPPWSVNRNPNRDEPCSPKAHAHVFVDDRALGCPTKIGSNGRPVVDWDIVGPALLKMTDAPDPTRCAPRVVDSEFKGVPPMTIEEYLATIPDDEKISPQEMLDEEMDCSRCGYPYCSCLGRSDRDLEATRALLEQHRVALVTALNAEPSTSLEGAVEIAGKYRAGMLEAEAERNDARQAFDNCYGELGDANTRADAAEQRVAAAVLALIGAEAETVDNAAEHMLFAVLMAAIGSGKWRDYLPTDKET